MVEDMLCTEIKRSSPKILHSTINPEFNIFDEKIKQKIGNFSAEKKKLTVKYDQKVQKIVPSSKKVEADLDFVANEEAYALYIPPKYTKVKNKNKKELSLGLWTSPNFPIKLETLIKMMSFFSLGHEAGGLIY